MDRLIQILMSVVALAMPIAKPVAQDDENDNQSEDTTSSSSSGEDEVKDEAKNNTLCQTDKSDKTTGHEKQLYEGASHIGGDRYYDSNQLQMPASSKGNHDSMSDLTESLSITSLDRAPSEASYLQIKPMGFIPSEGLHEHRHNLSFSSLSADDLTLDARECPVPRGMLRGATSRPRKEKQKRNKDTRPRERKHEQSREPKRQDIDPDAMKGFISDLVREQISQHSSQRLKFYDAAILYAKEDYEEALDFKEEAENIVKSDLLENDVRIELSDSQEFAQSKVCVVEDVLKRCSVVFVFLTPNFTSPDVKFFIEEAIGMSRLDCRNPWDIHSRFENKETEWILRPVHTMPLKSRNYHIPPGLLSLNGIEWYNRTSQHTRQQIRSVMHKAITTRKQRELGSTPPLLFQNNTTYNQELHPHAKELPVFNAPQQQQFMSRQSQDAMSMGDGTRSQSSRGDFYPSLPNERFLSRRDHFSNQRFDAYGHLDPRNSINNFQNGGYDQRNNQMRLNEYPQSHNYMDQHPSSFYDDRLLSQPNTSVSQRSDYQTPSSRNRSTHHHNGPLDQNRLGFQSQQVRTDTNQRGTFAQTPFVIQSAGLQNGNTQPNCNLQINQYEAKVPQGSFQEFSSRPEHTFSTLQSGLSDQYGVQRMCQLPTSATSGNSFRPPSTPILPQTYLMQSNVANTSMRSPVIHQNGILRNSSSIYNGPVSRDALHSQSGSFVQGDIAAAGSSTGASAISKVTGKLIINRNLSTDDVEIDTNTSTPLQSMNLEENRKSQTSREHQQKKKTRKNHSRYDFESSDSDSDFELLTKATKNSKKVVNIVGCKVVQFGSGNKVKESNNKERRKMVESKSKVSESKVKAEKKSNNTDIPSKRFSSLAENVSPNLERSWDVSADELSLGNSVEWNTNIASHEKPIVNEKKNIPVLEMTKSQIPLLTRNIPYAMDSPSSANAMNAEANRNTSLLIGRRQDEHRDNIKSFARSISSSSSDNAASEDYLFQSGDYNSKADYNPGKIFNSETTSVNMSKKTVFSFSSKTWRMKNAMDIFCDTKHWQTGDSNTVDDQLHEDSEVD